MAKQRDKIRMSDEEIWALFDGRKSLQVVTLNADGSPHLTTLWFAVDNGTLVFETYGKSQKVLNLRRDPRIAVLVEAGETYDQLRGVSINGHAEIKDEWADVKALATKVMRRNHPDVSDEQLGPMVDSMAAKRVAIVVHPEKIVSWDHRKIAAAKAG